MICTYTKAFSLNHHAKFLSVLFLFLSIRFVSAQSTVNKTELRIDSLFSHYTSVTPGVAVGVVKEGKLIFSKGYGMANLEYDIPITPKTVFHVASVSKQFTAFAIFLLAQEGAIGFEEDIRKYLPEVPSFGKEIKIKHLLSHTSGLRDQWALLTLAGWRLDDVITTEQILKLVKKQGHLNFNPGEEFSYCNTGFTLLAEIIELVTGQTFVEYTVDKIFKPLGMYSTIFYDDHQQIIKNRAYAYEMDSQRYEKRKLNYSTVGATSLVTTVEDLSKWALNYENHVVGDADLFEEFNTPSILNDGTKAVYAVLNGDTVYHAKGQFFRSYRGLKLYNHGGHDAGYRAYLARFPNEKFSIITLSNDEHYQILKTGLQLSEFYLGSKMEKENFPETLDTESIKLSHDDVLKDLKIYEGTYYSSELGTEYDVNLVDGKLVMRHRRLSDTPLKYVGKNTFSGVITFSVSVEFLTSKNEAITGFQISNFGARNILFERVGQ